MYLIVQRKKTMISNGFSFYPVHLHKTYMVTSSHVNLQEQRLDDLQNISSIRSDLTSNMAAIDHNSFFLLSEILT